MRALDWSATPLGRPEDWPQSLKTVVRVMLDSRYAMWMLWGPDLTFFCNDAYLPTVGIKREWVLGARSDRVWEEVWPEVEPRLQQVLEHGRATWDERLLLFLERSGFPEETYHTFSYSPVYDDDSQIAGMLCVVTEVTERVIGERHLRVLRDLAARAGRVESVQRACDRLLAVLTEDPLDVPFACLYLIDEARGLAWLASGGGTLPESLRPATLLLTDEHPWPIAQAVRSESPIIVDLRGGAHSTPIPAPLWPDQPIGKAVVIPVQRQGSSATAAVLIAGVSPRRSFDDDYRAFFDLVSRQFAAAIGDAQAYEAERRRAEALAEVDRAKTTFFSNVSHEFRTPLTLMLGPLEEMLASRDAPRPLRAHLELAHRNALRLLKLVNSLLDFSRIEAGRVQASYEPIDFAALCQDLASTFRSAIERAGLKFDVRCEAVGERVYLDREMWEKIVLNLLSNAFKFTLRGSIAVRTVREGAQAVLEVADTGVGIAQAELPRLFERFHRIENTQARTQEGSGIGLALVQELVHLQGGMIEVASEKRFGTLFRIRVPLGFAHLAPERIRAPRGLASTATAARAFVEEALRWLPEANGEASSRLALATDVAVQSLDPRTAPSSGARIVLADDNADMRGYMRDLLSRFYNIEAVADGQEALAAIRRESPELVLSDVMMPRLDGFGLLKALREDPKLRRIPFILLSARAGEEARIDGLDAGADDYLVKPFSARELLARVGASLTLARERRTYEELLREQGATLREADRRKNEFLAMLAHELRNPLAPIGNASEVLALTMPADERARTALSMIKRQVLHLTRLVDDLLDVSRITQGLTQLKLQPVDLAAAIAQAIEMLGPLLRQKQHRISIATSSYDPLYVNGDFARLVQCIGNIVGNAAKYTDPHGEIRVSTRAEDSIAIIEVSDTGVGIAPQLMPRIFDLFVQSDRTLDRSQGGLGIGLSVVKQLVEMHDGQVIARSPGVGQGSTFEIRLPRVVRPEGVAARMQPLKVPPQRILLVDDNSDAANSLALLLGLNGHEVRVSYSAQEALERVKSFRPDVALLDIGLPEMDGYELARRLRADSAVTGLRLIALTGYGQAQDRQHTQAAGFDDHLIKPVDLADIEAALGVTAAAAAVAAGVSSG